MHLIVIVSDTSLLIGPVAIKCTSGHLVNIPVTPSR